MEIEPIKNSNYDQRGQYQKYFRARSQKNKNSARQPIDAVTFDSVMIKNQNLQKHRDRLVLEAYINALPDEEVNRRMKEFKGSFDDIDSALIDKLIMEAL